MQDLVLRITLHNFMEILENLVMFSKKIIHLDTEDLLRFFLCDKIKFWTEYDDLTNSRVTALELALLVTS